MGKACEESPPGQLLQGVREFNRCDWYDCHETVEELWLGAHGELRDLYQGIIQIAVALHHWRNGNFAGAVSLLQSGTGYLERVPGRCQWLDVSGLCRDAGHFRQALEECGAARMSAVAAELIPKIRTVAA